MKNIVSLLGSRLIVPCMSSLLIFLIARKCGHEGMGVYASVFAINAVFSSISTIGLRNIVIRDVGVDRELFVDFFANGAVVVCLFSFVSYLIMAGFVALNYSDPRVVTGTHITCISLVPFSVAFIVESLFIALGHNGIIFVNTVIQHGFRVLMSILVIFNGKSLNYVFAVFTLSNFLLLLLYLHSLRKLHLLKFKIDAHFIKSRILSNLALFSALDVVANIYSKMGVLLLTRQTSVTVVGVYAAGTGLNAIINMVPANFAVAMYPKLAAAHEKNEDLPAVATSSIRQILLLVIPMITLCWFYAPELIGLMYGKKYASSVPIFRTVLLGLLPYSISIIFSYTLLGSKRQKYECGFVVANTVVSFLLYYFLIGNYGAAGAATVAAISPAVLLVMQYCFIRKRVLDLRLSRGILGFAAVMSSWILFVALLRQFELPFILSMVLCSVIYCIVILNSGFLSGSEKRMILSVNVFRKLCWNE
jgi:O-antigen/teichoic acid export membrane protein